MLVLLDIETLKILEHSCLPHPITHSPATHTYTHTHPHTHTLPKLGPAPASAALHLLCLQAPHDRRGPR